MTVIRFSTLFLARSPTCRSPWHTGPLTTVPVFWEQQAAMLRSQLQLQEAFQSYARAWLGLTSLLSAKQSLLRSALINTLYSKCTLDAER